MGRNKGRIANVVVHVQTSDDKFESTMDGERQEGGSRYQIVQSSRLSETVDARTLERVLVVVDHHFCA